MSKKKSNKKSKKNCQDISNVESTDVMSRRNIRMSLTYFEKIFCNCMKADLYGCCCVGQYKTFEDMKKVFTDTHMLSFIKFLLCKHLKNY